MTAGGQVSETISRRRSLRKFSKRVVAPELVDELIALACAAPAPHHSRPWRFAHIATSEARDALADAMLDSWRKELEGEKTVHEVAKMLDRSRRQIVEAPSLLVACLSVESAPAWPDQARRLAERDMFMQSLGAALQNLLLGAVERGLAGYLKGAPLFCQDAVRQAMRLPPDWEPAFLVILGYPEDGWQPEPRAAIDVLDFLIER